MFIILLYCIHIDVTSCWFLFSLSFLSLPLLFFLVYKYNNQEWW
jgi:hypothetical protein